MDIFYLYSRFTTHRRHLLVEFETRRLTREIRALDNRWLHRIGNQKYLLQFPSSSLLRRMILYSHRLSFVMTPSLDKRWRNLNRNRNMSGYTDTFAHVCFPNRRVEYMWWVLRLSAALLQIKFGLIFLPLREVYI